MAERSRLTSLDVEEVESALEVLKDMVDTTQNENNEKALTSIMIAIQEDNAEVLFENILQEETDLEEKDDEGNTAVMWAIMKNKPEYLKLLMNMEASPDVCNKEHFYPIHKAVDSGNDEMVDILCQCGANMNVVDYNGQTALHYAVYYGNIPIIMTLLKYHAKVNVADFTGKTALFIAVWKGNTDIIRLLLENNADVNATTKVNFYPGSDVEDDKVTPAMYAAATGYIRGLELLLNFGADPHMRENPHKRSALFYASLFNHMPCVDVILRESNIGQALIDASKKGHTDYLKLLLEFKPDLETTDDRGETALTKAAKHEVKELLKEPIDLTDATKVATQDEDVMELLLKAGAKVDPVLGEEYSITPLMSAAYWGNVNNVRILLDKNASVNLINGKRETALWFAADQGNTECLELLLDAGAPANLASSSGTPLMAAINNMKCFRALLKRGCETSYTNDEGDCAVTLASSRWSEDYIKLLIKHKADLKVVDGKGWSPVMLATSKKVYSTLKELLDNGAEINHADNTGMTALHIAAQKDFISCMELLVSYKPNLNPVMQKTKRCMPWTPLTCAIKRSSKRGLILLLEAGARASIPDSAGLKTIMTRTFTVQTVKVLHAAGADPDYLPDLVHKGDNDRRNLPRWQLRHQQPNYPTDVHDQDNDSTLFNICRLKIRAHLLQVQQQNLFHTVPLLPLPVLVQSSLLFDVKLN